MSPTFPLYYNIQVLALQTYLSSNMVILVVLSFQLIYYGYIVYEVTQGGRNMKNKVAMYLKILSIVLFIISIFTAFSDASNADYGMSWYNGYALGRTFNGSIFFSTLLSSTVSCLLLYAVGEFIELTAQRNELLKKGLHVTDDVNPVAEPFTKAKEKKDESKEEPIPMEHMVNWKTKQSMQEVVNALKDISQSNELSSINFQSTSYSENPFTFGFKVVDRSKGISGDIILELSDAEETTMIIKYHNKDLYSYLTPFKNLLITTIEKNKVIHE